MRRSHGWLALGGFVAAVAGAAWFGSRSSPREGSTAQWYASLEKPPFNPPDAAFPVVWTGLYTLIAISGWRVWQGPDSRARTNALRLWIAQLLANAAWSRLFFAEQLPTWSLLDILALESAVLGYIAEARTVDKRGALLFAPYALWVAFAAVLNAEIVRRNPRAAGC